MAYLLACGIKLEHGTDRYIEFDMPRSSSKWLKHMCEAGVEHHIIFPHDGTSSGSSQTDEEDDAEDGETEDDDISRGRFSRVTALSRTAMFTALRTSQGVSGRWTTGNGSSPHVRVRVPGNSSGALFASWALE